MKLKLALISFLLFLCLCTSANATPVNGLYTDIGDGEWREYLINGNEGEAGNLLYAKDTVGGAFGKLFVGKSLDLISILSIETGVDGNGAYTLYTTQYSNGLLRIGSDIWDTTGAENAWYDSNDVTAIVYAKKYANSYEGSVELFGTFNDYASVSYFVTADLLFGGTGIGGNLKLDGTTRYKNPGWGDDGDMAYIYGTLENVSMNVVPEPSTMLLLGAGLIGLAGATRKKLKK